MKKNKIILSLFVLLITSFSLFSQKIEDEFLTGDDGFGDLPTSPYPTTEISNFSFVNSDNALFIASVNQALLIDAQNSAGQTAWFNKQKEIIKSELEKKFNKTFASYDDAKDELFRYSEVNNISKNSVTPRNEFNTLKSNGFTKQGKYLEDIKILELRGLEIKAGNIHNPKYGYLEVDGIEMKNITNIEALNVKWDNIYNQFSTNYRTTYFNNSVHYNLSHLDQGLLGQGLTDLVLSLKNGYYNNFDGWEQLNYMQFLINYEYYKNLHPLYHSQELLRLFNKFKDTDKGTPTVIKNYAIGRGTYPSNFKEDNGLSKEIYELLQNPADYNEASILARKEADRLRGDADALDGLLNGVSTIKFAVKNVKAQLTGLSSSQISWLERVENASQVIKINNFLSSHKIGTDASPEALSFAYAALDALMRNSKINWDKQIIIDESVPICVENIINKIISNNVNMDLGDMPDFVKAQLNLSGHIMDIFNNSDKYNLVFKVGDLPLNSAGLEKNAQNATKNNIRTNGTVEFVITLNSSYVNNATDLALARTIIHESIHAYINFMSGTQMTSDLSIALSDLLARGYSRNSAQHLIMSKRFVEDISAAIEKWDNSSLVDKNYYDYISWSGGMLNTTVFNSLSTDFKTNSMNANINEGNAGVGRMKTNNAKGTKNCN